MKLEQRLLEQAWFRCWAFVLCFVLISACSRIDTARKLAPPSFAEQVFTTSYFPIKSFSRHADTQTVRIYIEGDGYAWRSRYRPSSDPTPKNPVTLGLAVRDDAPAVLYLARPCQYIRGALCDVSYWTDARFSNQVVASYDEIMDELKARYGYQNFELVGYSGGGVVAQILAYQRDDVRLLATVASPLDHALWTQHHGVTSLSKSINPADMTPKNTALRQYHFCGKRDTIVPCHLTQSFVRQLTPVETTISVDSDHQCCWQKLWPDILSRLH